MEPVLPRTHLRFEPSSILFALGRSTRVWSKRGWPTKILVTLAHVFGAMFSTVACAEEPLDRVDLAPVKTRAWDSWQPPAPTEFQGRIIDFDAGKLLLRRPDGSTLELPSERVQHVTFAWNTAEVAAASDLVKAHDYVGAIDRIPKVYSQAPKWQQRILLAQLVQALDAAGYSRKAGVIFLDVVRDSPLPLMLYADMPLCWTPREADATLLETAKQWLAGSDETERLLGASWLLFGPEHAAAERSLVGLRASAQPAVALLAGAQSWRLVPPPETLQRLDEWFAFRDQMLQPLQIGPTEFLADRLRRGGELDLAIGQWVRIATLHAPRYHRAANALENASQQLRLSAQQDQAQRLQPWIVQLRDE